MSDKEYIQIEANLLIAKAKVDTLEKASNEILKLLQAAIKEEPDASYSLYLAQRERKNKLG